MKIIFEKVPISKTSFLFKQEFFPHFDIPWHNHPEFELALLVEGEGKKIVGDNISYFKMGDLSLIGPWLPHLWRSHETSPQYAGEVEQIIIQFSENFLGEDFFEKPEFIRIKNLLHRAGQGLLILGKTKAAVSEEMKQMIEANDFEKVLMLLKILDTLARSEETLGLSTPGFVNSYNVADSERMNAIYKFLLENFKKTVYLQDIAEIAHLTPPSFSRYFKSRTKKAFSQVLNEVRIGHACKLLLEQNLTVSQIADECGFSNLSNFNRSFKIITKISPVKYVDQYK